MARRIEVEIVGDTRSLERSFKRGAQSAKGFNQDITRATVGVKGLGRSIIKTGLAFAGLEIGFRGVARVFEDSTEAAAHLEDQVDRTRRVFGAQASAALVASRISATATGQSRAAFLETASSLDQLLKRLGVVPAAAARMSLGFEKLAADVGVFQRKDPSVVLDAFRKAVAGQYRGLLALNIGLKETTVLQEANRLGLVRHTVSSVKAQDAQLRLNIAAFAYRQAIKKHGESSVQAARALLSLRHAQEASNKANAGAADELTSAQRAAAVYSLILKQTRDVQGTFARSTGSLSVQQRILRAELIDQEAILGRQLLPIQLEVVKSIADWLGKSKNQARVQRDLKEAVSTTKTVLQDIDGVIQDVNRVTGGWKHTIELLLALKVASVVAGWTDSVTGFGRAAGKADAKLGGLLGRLAQLKAVKLISIPIVVDLIVKGLGKNRGFDTSDPVANEGPPIAFFQHHQGRKFPAGSNQRRAQDDYDKGLRGAPDPHPFSVNAYQAGQADRAFAEAHSSGIGFDPNKAATQIRKQAAAKAQAAAGLTPTTTGALTDGAAAVDKALQRLDLELSRAQLTSTQADDLRVLNQEKTLLEKRIRITKDNLDLQQKLVDVQGQIQSITKEAVDRERSLFGTLFQGPILAPTEADQKRRLGVPGASGGKLTADLRAQNAAFAAEQRDLARLAKRGAPTALLDELRALGPEGASFAHTLATESAKEFNAFLRQFAIREKQVNRQGRIDVTANVVNINTKRLNTTSGKQGQNRPVHQTVTQHNSITIHDARNSDQVARNTAEHLQRRAKGSAAQRTGRNAGTRVGLQ